MSIFRHSLQRWSKKDSRLRELLLRCGQRLKDVGSGNPWPNVLIIPVLAVGINQHLYYRWGSHLFRRFCKMFSESSRLLAVLQLQGWGSSHWERIAVTVPSTHGQTYLLTDSTGAEAQKERCSFFPHPCAAALSFRKHFTKPLERVADPPSIMYWALHHL